MKHPYRISIVPLLLLGYLCFGCGTEGSLGQAEIATGPSFGAWTRVPLTPNYPELVDTHFDTTCLLQNAADGVSRCLPSLSAALSDMFSDAECQQRSRRSLPQVLSGLIDAQFRIQ